MHAPCILSADHLGDFSGVCGKPYILEADDLLEACCGKAMNPKKLWTLYFFPIHDPKGSRRTLIGVCPLCCKNFPFASRFCTGDRVAGGSRSKNLLEEAVKQMLNQPRGSFPEISLYRSISAVFGPYLCNPLSLKLWSLKQLMEMHAVILEVVWGGGVVLNQGEDKTNSQIFSEPHCALHCVYSPTKIFM